MATELDRYDRRGLRWAESLANAVALPTTELLEVAAGFFVDAARPRHQPPTSASTADITPLRETAGRLHELFSVDDADAAAAILNTVLAVARARPVVTRHDDAGWHVHYVADDADASAIIAATAAMALAGVICDSGVTRLGFCAADGCANAFVDLSKNNSKRYCSSRCATRESVAAHRRRGREHT